MKVFDGAPKRRTPVNTGEALPIRERTFSKAEFLANVHAFAQEEQRGHKNVGLYRFADAFVKVVLAPRGYKAIDVERLHTRTHDLPNVYAPKEVFHLPNGNQAIVMGVAEGTSGHLLTDEEIEAIPAEHWSEFEQTLRMLSARGIPTDLTKRDNFVYNRERGFLCIDMQKPTPEEVSTGKFFMQDGVEKYYPFEHFRLFPKPYTGPKDLFVSMPHGSVDPE